MTRHLVLIRHADTESIRPGHRDIERRLTNLGVAQAAAAGRWLQQRHRVDTALCSPATRTRETLTELRVRAPTGFPDWLYNGGEDVILAGIRELDPSARTALVVGHAPGVPAVVYALADPHTSDPEAVALVRNHYPAGTLAVLRIGDAWADLSAAALVAVLPPYRA